MNSIKVKWATLGLSVVLGCASPSDSKDPSIQDWTPEPTLTGIPEATKPTSSSSRTPVPAVSAPGDECAVDTSFAQVPLEDIFEVPVLEDWCALSPDSCLAWRPGNTRDHKPRPCAIEGNDGSTLFELKHDERGRLRSIYRGSHGEDFSFDGCGRPLKHFAIYGMAGSTREWKRGRSGNIISSSESRGDLSSVTTYVRDNAGALVSASTSIEAQQTTRPGRSSRYELDDERRLARTFEVKGTTEEKVEERTYSADGSLQRITGLDAARNVFTNEYSSGKLIHYRIDNPRDSGAIEEFRTWTPQGWLETIHRTQNGVGGDGFLLKYTYGSDGRMLSVEKNGASWSRARFEYDPNGVLQGATEEGVHADGAHWSKWRSYKYQCK